MLVYCKGRVPCAAWDTARGSRHVVLGSRPGVKILKGCRFPHLHRYRTPLDPIGAYGERQRIQPISQPKKSLDIALPNLDDINGAKAYQGAISGVLVGTGLSLGVSALKATFVAGVVAALVALLPAKSGEEVEEALQNEGAELPGVAAISLANQGKDALTGKTKLRPDVTATVATASVTAGALVAVFAAKSLGIALAGTLAFIAISKDNDLDISTATVEGRDYLRTRGYSGPGVAASLLLLQASTAAQKISEVVQNYARSTTSSASSRAGAYSPLQAVPSGAGLGSAAPLDSSSSVGSGGLLERSGRGGQGITSAGSSAPGPVSPSVMKASGTTDGEARASGGEAKVAEREAEAPASPLSGPSSPIGARPGNGAGIATGSDKNADATEPTPPPPEDEEDPAPAARKAAVGNGAANGAPQGSRKGVDATEPKQPPPEEQDPTPPAAGAGLEGSGKDVDATEPQLPVEDESESAPPADGGPPKNAGQNVEATAPVTAPVTPVEASGDEDTKTGGSGGGGGSGKDSGLLVEARRNWEANAPSTPVLQDQGDGNLLTQALQHRAKSDIQNPLAEQLATKKEEAGDLLSAALKLRNLLNKPATITLPSPESKSEGLLEAARKLREQAIGPSKARLPPPGASPLDQVKQAKSAAAAPASSPTVSEPVKSSPLPSGDAVPQKTEETTPLEGIKGKSEEVEAEDLAPTPTEFKPTEDSTPLSRDTSSEKEAESTPLEDIKGKNEDAVAGDLAPTPTAFEPTEDSTPLSRETAPEKQGDSTPLEDIKGKNEDAAAGGLASTPTAFEPTEDSTPLSGDQTSEKQDDSTPLEKMKGKNEDVAAGDLASTPTTFEPSEGSTPLSGDAPSQEEEDTTPLEKLKGKNEDAAAGLDSAPTTFKPTEGDTPLSGDQPIQKAEDSTPLESIKGKNEDVAAGDLASTPTAFKPTEDSTPLGSQTSAEKQDDSTPLENIKGKNEDVAAGDLASTPTAFKPAEDSTPLSGGAPAQEPEESTYLDSIQAESDDEVDAIRLASNPLTFTPPEGAVLDRGDDAWKSGGRGSDSGFKERALSGGLGYDSSRASGGGEPRSGMLRAQQAQGIGRTLQLLSLLAPIQKPPQGPASSVSGGGKGTSAAAPTTPTPTPTPTPTATPSLGSTQDRQAAGPKQSNVLQVQTSGAGKVMSLLTFSTKAPGAATSAPFQPGKLATEQPPPQKPAPRSAARPIVSPALKVSSAPPGAARGVGLGGASVPSLTKASANVPTPPVTGYMGRAREADSNAQGPRRLTPQEQTKAAAVAGGGPPVPKKRTLVENLMLLAGSSAVGGMLALTWRMVRGFAATDPTNRALGAFLAICVVLLVILSNLRPKRPPTPATA